MAKFGYALSQGLAAGAQGVGMLADAALKERTDQATSDRQLAAYEKQKNIDALMSERAAAYKQTLQQKQGADIDATAKGLLSTARDKDIQSKFGGQTAAEFDAEGGSLPEERKMVEPSRLASLQAKADAAEAKGYFDQAKEIRAQIQTEVQNVRNEKQDVRETDRNNDRARFNEDKLALMGQLQDAKANLNAANLAARSAQKDLPATTKLMVDSYNKRISELEKELSNPLTAMDDKKVATLKSQIGELSNKIETELGRAPSSGGGSTPKAAPQVGAVVDGYVFNGGDPANKDSWKPTAASAPVKNPSQVNLQTAPSGTVNPNSQGAAKPVQMVDVPVARLWQNTASTDPAVKKLAVEELKRRGLWTEDTPAPQQQGRGMLAEPL